MIRLIEHAAITLLIAFAISLVYEFYRATARSGVSQHDSLKVFVTQLVPLYLAAGLVIAFLFLGYAWAPWVGLAFSIVMIGSSIFYYNPKIMLDRRPALVDWIEDLVFTGLLFVAAAQLAYALVVPGLA